jgi:hypothetical protein
MGGSPTKENLHKLEEEKAKSGQHLAMYYKN